LILKISHHCRIVWLSTETVFESLLGSGSMTIELPLFPEDLCVLLNDLFATSLNYNLETFVSPIPDQKAWAVDAMIISWKGMFNYIFPPFRLLHRILHKIRQDGCKTILIAPAWPRQSPTIIVCTTASSSLERGPFVSIKGKEASSRPGETPSARMIAVRTSISQRGCNAGITITPEPISDNCFLAKKKLGQSKG
jgi:hypothetical protein